MTAFMDILLSLMTLTLLEIILGVDNLVFLAIISQRLPKGQQQSARRLGLTLAWITRLLLLASAVWLTHLTSPLFSFWEFAFSGRDLFMLLGGLFLIIKATQEIHLELEAEIQQPQSKTLKQHFFFVICQIALLDIIFSLDSVLTAIGLTQRYWVMAIAITIAIITMIFTSEVLSAFIERHPTVKMLALSFLLLIGTVLIADGFSFYIPRAYIYTTMGFSLFVEFLNITKRHRSKNTV